MLYSISQQDPQFCLVSEGSLTISKAVGEPRPQRDPSSLHVPDTPISSPGDSVTQALPLPQEMEGSVEMGGAFGVTPHSDVAHPAA